MKDDTLYTIYRNASIGYDYLGIDIETVWVIISKELAELRRAVQK